MNKKEEIIEEVIKIPVQNWKVDKRGYSTTIRNKKVILNIPHAQLDPWIVIDEVNFFDNNIPELLKIIEDHYNKLAVENEERAINTLYNEMFPKR